MDVIEYINSFMPLSDGAIEELSSKAKTRDLPNHYLLHKEGEICNRTFYVEKGLVRWYYLNEDGRDITDSFALENSFVTAFDSFFQRRPSRYFIETLEDSVITSITYDDLEETFEKFPEVQKLSRLILIQILEQVLDKNVALQFQNAKERYEYITEKHPDLLRRVSLGHIASFLGITQETLSRIRAKK